MLLHDYLSKRSILDRFDALCNDISNGIPAEIAARQKQSGIFCIEPVASQRDALFKTLQVCCRTILDRCQEWIHKAQGAEYPVVVMPIMMTHFSMLQRNLLYTGVTRAKTGLILVGQKKAVGYCVRNVTVDKRNTLLAERLSGKI